MKINNKQKAFLKDFFNLIGKKDIFILAGGAGSGKSFISLLLVHFLAISHPNLRVGVFRKTSINLKNSTIPSYKRILELTGTTRLVKMVSMTANYKNGSKILFLGADTEKDPDCDNLKGLELSCALFEEVNQLDERVFDVVRSRVGRWLPDCSTVC